MQAYDDDGVSDWSRWWQQLTKHFFWYKSDGELTNDHGVSSQRMNVKSLRLSKQLYKQHQLANW